MPKYTKEFKIKLVLEYLSGESGGLKSIAKTYKIPKSTLELWINKYKSGGFDNLSKKLKSNKFTSEFKLSVIQYRQINNTSLRETAEYFDIANGAMICNWEKKYKESGLSGLEGNRGRPRKDMSKSNKNSKLSNPISETEREELIRLREENRLLKMKIIYEKKLQALLLEEEAEARKRQR
ncbi:helix-turn-helix domain containing protein [Finegoldia magna]|uniref:helix-turn-helix domain containing protein n=1 Tax=Finegoldia TaxID=150022 RepID=UPI0023A9892B|nr:helix-turn-helix domain-containing protein [Finegoldia magna]MCC2718169.1 helix-turn-helix domain-containing protein [Finegoldia magna]MDU3805937.1 helix-turn-helix domain-containing protein [Finegoldia magna]